MIDLTTLKGSTVRDNAGTRGELLGLSLPWIKVGWWDEGSASMRVEAFLRSDPRVSSIDILTITEGWVAASRLIGTEEEEETSLSEDLESLIAEAAGGKKRSPFKTASKIGPGPRFGWRHGGPHKMKHKKRDYWDCSCTNYKCKCKGKEGEDKTVNIKKGYKSGYNKEYKFWRKSKKASIAPKKYLKKKKK